MTETLKTVVKEASEKAGKSTSAEGTKVANAVEEAVKDDPVLMNRLGQERWWQSGIAWYGTGGVLWAIGFLLKQFSENQFDLTGYDAETTLVALGALGANLGVIYRRFWPGLRPMWSGIFGAG
jgi:hypothetical protein